MFRSRRDRSSALCSDARLLLGNLAPLTGMEEPTRSRSVKRQSRQRYLKKHWGQKLMWTSKKSTDILEVVKVLMCASKIWDLFLETDSKDEGHLLHFCRVYVGGGHKASRASL